MTFRDLAQRFRGRAKLSHPCRLTWACAALLGTLLPLQQVVAGQLRVAVAANFTGASRELAQRFEATTGHRLKISYGSSGKLFSQIENGAPFEVFLAADHLLPQKAIAEGLAIDGSRFSYARGTLVLWSSQPGLFTDSNDADTYLRQADFQRIAIANPKTAPYGLAAQQVLNHLGLWDALQDRLVRADSIAQAFQFTATANARLGFVAQSQIQAWGAPSGSLWQIPESYYRAIDQQAVLLNRGQHNPVAQQFLQFLKGPQGRAIISAHGYRLPIQEPL